MPVIEQKTTNKNKVDFDLNRLDKSKTTIFSKYPFYNTLSGKLFQYALHETHEFGASIVKLNSTLSSVSLEFNLTNLEVSLVAQLVIWPVPRYAKLWSKVCRRFMKKQR